MAAETSPVCAPAELGATSCAPQRTRVPARVAAVDSSTGKLGRTTTSMAPAPRSSTTVRTSRTSRTHLYGLGCRQVHLQAHRYQCPPGGRRGVAGQRCLLVSCVGVGQPVLLGHFLILGDRADLLGAVAGRIEGVAKPLPREPAGELDADDALAHAEDLGVVGKDRALDRERVVGSHRTDSLYLVGADGNAEPRAADQDRAVGLTGNEKPGCRDGNVGVRRVLDPADADVDDASYARIVLQVSADGLLVLETGLITAHDEAKALRLVFGGEGHFRPRCWRAGGQVRRTPLRGGRRWGRRRGRRGRGYRGWRQRESGPCRGERRCLLCFRPRSWRRRRRRSRWQR